MVAPYDMFCSFMAVILTADDCENMKLLSSVKREPCPGLVDYVMIWTKELFIKNEKSTIDVLISWVNKT